MNDPKPSSRPSRRRRRLLWAAVILLIVGSPFAYFFYHHWQAGRDLADAIAELDRTDPGWRLEDIEAKRREVPDEENSAWIIVAAHGFFPRGWTDPKVDEEFSKVPPPVMLSPGQEKKLRKTLAPVGKALEEAHKLADFPTGRHNLVYTPDFISSPVTDQLNTPSVADLLRLDIRLLLQDRKMAEAGKSCMAILNAGRSLGDQPMGMSLMIRLPLTSMAIVNLERSLAMGQIPEPILRRMQKSLREEADENLAFTAFRGERAGRHQCFSNVEAGVVTLAQLGVANQSSGFRLWDYLPGSSTVPKTKRIHAWALRFWTRVIEATKKTGAEREHALASLEQESKEIRQKHSDPADKPWGTLSLLPLNFIQSEQRIDTRLHCAIAALAAEQFRLKYDRWPKSLGGLVEEKFLSKIPIDLFDGQPLRFRPTADGLVVYSIGPEKNYDGTALDDLTMYDPDSKRIEFRLWNPDRRRQPAMTKRSEKP